MRRFKLSLEILGDKEDGIFVRESVDVVRLMEPVVAGMDREAFWVLPLTTKKEVMALDTVSVGTLSCSLVHPREVFKSLILCSAQAFVGVHVHPSGDPAPSYDDESVSKRLVEVGKLLGIHMLDHIIMARDGHFSFADEGKL